MLKIICLVFQEISRCGGTVNISCNYYGYRYRGKNFFCTNRFIPPLVLIVAVEKQVKWGS